MEVNLTGASLRISPKSIESLTCDIKEIADAGLCVTRSLQFFSSNACTLAERDPWSDASPGAKLNVSHLYFYDAVMAEFAEFSAMVLRLRSGDPLVVEQFISTYEPFIRRAVRRSLTQSGLRAVADSRDICQSVLASFLVRMAAGEFEVDGQPALEGLLVTIARRRLAMLCRRETGATRDRRREQSLDSRMEVRDRSMQDPRIVAETLDLVATFRSRLTESERTLFDQRRLGDDWETIAAKTQENVLALRKRLSRALKRVSEELGLDDSP